MITEQGLIILSDAKGVFLGCFFLLKDYEDSRTFLNYCLNFKAPQQKTIIKKKKKKERKNLKNF